MPYINIGPCLTPECKKTGKVRGLCGSCYNSLRSRILKKELTWEEAEQRNLCRKAKPRKAWDSYYFRRAKI